MDISKTNGPRGTLRNNVRVRDILSLIRPYRLAIIIVFIVGVLATAATLVQPLAIRAIIEAVSSGESIRQPLAVFILLFTVAVILQTLQAYLLGRTGSDLTFSLRRGLTQHLLRLTHSEHDRLRTGDLLSRVGADTVALRDVLTTRSLQAALSLLTILGALILMLTIDWELLIIVLIGLFIPAVLIWYASPKLRAANYESQTRVGSMTAALEQALGALQTVKASRSELREVDHISQEARLARNASVSLAKINALLNAAVSTSIQGCFVLVLGIGGVRLATDSISAAQLVTFLLYLLFAVNPLTRLSTFFSSLQRGLAAAQRVNEVFNLQTSRGGEPSVLENSRGPEIKKPYNAGFPIIQFDAVSFEYGNGQSVLREVSFDVPENTKTALVGPSGAGKSTIFNLIERFYEPDSGSIRLYGVDTNSIPIPQMRSLIGYVEQECPIMAGTIQSNLLYANPEASEEEVERVLDITNLRSCIDRSPGGLDAKVGDEGVLLSGGERQRIAIARALLVRPELLLLDEATSQLDAENEQSLREAVSQARYECTVMVIAHRLSTVIDADRIIVLDGKGKVSNVGTHEELLRTDLLYKRLAQEQFVR